MTQLLIEEAGRNDEHAVFRLVNDTLHIGDYNETCRYTLTRDEAAQLYVWLGALLQAWRE